MQISYEIISNFRFILYTDPQHHCFRIIILKFLQQLVFQNLLNVLIGCWVNTVGRKYDLYIKTLQIGPLHGQVLLELSDLELECGLGITHPMHKKKIRMAIEEHRNPGLIRYPYIAQLGHTWVSSEWLPDLGLSQVSFI